MNTLEHTRPAENRAELTRRGMVQDPSFRQALGASAATLTVIMSFPLAAGVVEKVTTHHSQPPHESHPSKIVGGVWSLVLSHHPSQDCEGVNNQPANILTCSGTPQDPRLLIEQCHRDVTNAQHQLWTVSFGDRVDEISVGCYDDWVAVSPGLWSENADGSKIRFSGTPDSHLEK